MCKVNEILTQVLFIRWDSTRRTDWMREEEPVEAPLAEDLVDDPPGGAERAWLGRVGGREGGRAAGPTGGVPAKAREAQQGPVPPGGIARRRERPPAPEARLTPGQVAAGEPCGGKCPRPTTCTPTRSTRDLTIAT